LKLPAGVDGTRLCGTVEADINILILQFVVTSLLLLVCSFVIQYIDTSICSIYKSIISTYWYTGRDSTNTSIVLLGDELR